MVLRNILVGALLALMAGAQTEPKPMSGASLVPPYSETLLRQLPRSDKDVEDRIALAQTRMEELQQLLAPTPPEAADEAATVVRSLEESAYRAWEAYANRLNRFKPLSVSVANLTSPEHLAAASEQLGQLQRDTDELDKAVTPAAIRDEQIRQVAAQVDTLQVHVSTLSDTQTRRLQMLATGFQEQQEQLEAELGQLRTEKEGLKRRTDATLAAAGPTEQQRLLLEHERVNVQTSAVELALATLPMERQEAELLSKQDERLLEASRKKLHALNRRLATLSEAQSRSRLEILEIERSQATDPIDSTLLDLRLLCEKASVHYFRRPKDIDALQRRFPQRALERITERISLSKPYWDRTIGSLEYCSGEEAAGLERQLEEERAEFAANLTMVRVRLARTMDESQGLQTVRENARKRFSSVAEKLAAELTALDVQDRAPREAEVTSLRAGLEESMRNAIKAWEDVAARLNDALSGLEQHELYLQVIGQQLRWKRIASRDPGLIGADWSTARAELGTLLRTQRPEPKTDVEKDAREVFREELFGEDTDSGAVLHALIRGGRADLAAASGVDWAWVASSIIASFGLGFVLYRVARWKGVRLARDIVKLYGTTQSAAASTGSGLSMRVNLMALNMVGDLAVPLLLASALVFSAWRVLDNDVLQMEVLAFFASIAVAITALRFVHHLFEAYSPPHRPIPCSDPVAKHYRWWLSMLIVLSLVALLVPLLLSVVDSARALQSVFLETYKACFLVLLLLFLFRKERVLGLGDVRHRHWGMMVAWIVYPLATTCVALLLLLQLSGFGALVTSVGTGLLVATGIVLSLGAVTEYLADIIDRHVGLTVESPDKPPPDVVDEMGDLNESRTRYSFKLLKALIRLAGLAGAILLVLWAWDVPIRSEWLAWRKFGFGAMVIVIALMIDRVAFAALYTLYASGRLPISTVNIIRRWARGVLALVVALIIVALAGFKMDSLWTFLTAVLAMLAIGFVAVWSILSNVLATFVILIWRPFNVGEWIEILPEGLEGQVVDINFVYTILKSEEGKKTAVPNNLFAQKFIRRSSVRGAPKRTLAEQLASDKPLEE